MSAAGWVIYGGITLALALTAVLLVIFVKDGRR